MLCKAFKSVTLVPTYSATCTVHPMHGVCTGYVSSALQRIDPGVYPGGRGTGCPPVQLKEIYQDSFKRAALVPALATT